MSTKDCYPILSIDQLVDEIVRHGIISFLNVYLGYHHKHMILEDEENMA